jgi:two-component system, LytTR family, response regulator
VDDEPLARERIRCLLKQETDVEVVGEAADGQSAIQALRNLRPDLLFLDVQMPGCDGFGVLEKLDADEVPVTVLVTAFDRYALQAFEVHALDYLLKPFDRRRFQESLRRARDQLRQAPNAEFGRRMLALCQDVATGETIYLERLIVKSGGRVLFVPIAEIDWVEAAGNYVRLHHGPNEHLIRETMNNLESKLDPRKFLRIHRSTMVNIDRVQELQPSFHGDYVVVLTTGAQLTLSRGYRESIQDKLGTAF